MNDERLLTPDEVAERLKLSSFTVANMLRAGTLPGFKLGTLWRVRAADLDAFIVAGSDAAAAVRETRAVDAERRRTAAQDKANAKRGARTRTKPLAEPAPPAEPPAEPGTEAPTAAPTEAERVAWASIGVPDEEDVYTPEYRAWLATPEYRKWQAGQAEPGDEDEEGAP